MHVKSDLVFAREARPRRSPEDLAVYDRARATAHAVQARPAVRAQLVRGRRGHRWYHATRADNSTSTLARLGEDIIALYNAGATEAEVALIEEYVRTLRLDLFSAGAQRSLDELDREEAAIEAEENILSLEARITRSPMALRRAAKVFRREAAIEIERARVYDLEAARRERESRRSSFPQPPRAA
jgi:hypothetical protein